MFGMMTICVPVRLSISARSPRFSFNKNAPMDKGEEHPALTAIKRAVALSDNVTAKERGLIEALALRYTPDGDASRADLDKRYAEAMTALHERFPDDQDIAVLYAEAQMDLSPWNYWERDYKTPLPHIAGAIAAVEDVLAANPDHAGAIHLHIHLLEASAMPERAEEGAERLADLCVVGSSSPRHRAAVATSMAYRRRERRRLKISDAADGRLEGAHVDRLVVIPNGVQE